MTLTYRSTAGRRLTVTEGDNNIYELSQSSGISFLQSGSGAIAQTVQQKLRIVQIDAWDFMSASQRSSVLANDQGLDMADAINAAAVYAATVINPNSLYTDQIKAGAEIVLPSATLITTSASIVLPTGVSIAGQGKTSSIIKSSFNGPIIRNSIDSGYNWFGAQLRDFGVYGDLTKASQYGIDLLRPLNCSARNIYVQGCGKDGVRIRQGIASTLEQVDSVYNKVNGIHIDGGVNSWADQVANNLPSNGNQLINCHGGFNDGPGLLFGSYTNGNVAYGGGYEGNYAASADNVGFQIELRNANSTAPNELIDIWTEGSGQAHIYQNAASGVVNRVTLWKHFGDGSAGNVDRAAIVDAGTLLIDKAYGNGSSYKSIAGSIKPFRVNKAGGTAIVWATDCVGSTITDGIFIEDETGATTSLYNQKRESNFNVAYGLSRHINQFGQNGPFFQQDTQSFDWFEFSNFYRGFQTGDGTAAVTTRHQHLADGQWGIRNSTGAGLNTRTATTLLSAVSGATVTATNLIPDGAFVIGVSTYVVTALGVSGGTTGYAVGDATDPNRWGDIVGTAIGTDSDNTDATANFTGAYIAADSVIITAAGGNFDGTGAIRVAVHYLDVTAPTS